MGGVPTAITVDKKGAKPVKRLRTLVCLLVTMPAFLNVAAQQITGSIRGTVNDPSGAFVESASVTARQIETGLARSTTTDRGGNYVLLELPVGHYELITEAKGFQKYIQQGINLNVNETANIAVRLVIGSETQEVEVISDAQLIQGTVTSLGKVVLEHEILDLPLDGRNFSQLGTLQPGVVPLTPGLKQAGSSLREGQSYAVNGQRPESNNFLIDGANNFNGVDGGFVLKPPVDAISEFRILTHNSTAEFGNSLGSTTNIITKSGTNGFHGAVWEFLRNDALDATNYFATTTEPLKQNQFGATIGGPIRKEKTFFFAFYEGFRNRQGETAGSTVPSVKQRNGDFSELCPEGFTAGLCNNPGHQLYLEVTNPLTPFPDNQLPPPLISTFAQGLLPLFPLPNTGLNTFTSTQTKQDDSNEGRDSHRSLSHWSRHSELSLHDQRWDALRPPFTGRGKRPRISDRRKSSGSELRSPGNTFVLSVLDWCRALLIPAK